MVLSHFFEGGLKMYHLTGSLNLFQFDHNRKNRQTAIAIMQNYQRAVQSRFLLSVGIILFILTSHASSAALFTTADFEGTWYMHALGVKENSGGCGYGTYVFENTGKFTGTYITSTGHTESPDGTLSINNDGIIMALPDFGTTAPSLHGIMSNKKDMIVCTHTGGDNSYKIMIFTKSVETIVTSDMQGTWIYHGLIAGNEPYQVARWWYGSMTIDGSGNAVFDSPIIDSLGTHEIPTDPLKLIITEGGIITELDPEIAPLHGAMNQSKDMIVFVDTVIATSMDVDAPGDALFVLVKQSPGAYTANDLAGTWHWHALVSGSFYDDWIGWYYTTSLIDRYGNANWVDGSYLNCKGETGQTWSGTMSIKSDGIITISNLPTFHGIMGLGKNMLVGTMDDGGGGYGLAICFGRPTNEFSLADFNNDGIINGDDFAFLVRDWGKTNIDSVADISGPDGIPDRNVDDFDLRAFCEQMFGVVLPSLPLETTNNFEMIETAIY
ncbi:MAG: hypothetical protein JXA81_05875 [Sedimentisphaerales bacterium]|nr:hypothetical protein [Sedimentisphaerales bacterium]